MITFYAITTKYHGPTDTKGSRITARLNKARVTVTYRHDLGENENHQRAAKILAERVQRGTWIGGVTSTGGVWVMTAAENGIESDSGFVAQ